MANAGFYVLRSRNRKSGFERVSPSLIVGAGTTAEQNTYTWRDTTAEVNVPYYYRLEEVSLSGKRRALATGSVAGFYIKCWQVALEVGGCENCGLIPSTSDNPFL